MGSNQYRLRPKADVLVREADLMAQAAATALGTSERRRCGEVWGTRCRTWVQPPDYSHDNHGLRGSLERLAENPNCPTWAQQRLVQSPQGEVRVSLASNPNCAPELLTQLAQDQIPAVQKTVATNPSAPPDAMRILARSPNPDVRLSAVSVGTACPPDVVALLAQDKRYNVRRLAARHPNCPPEAFEHLLRDRRVEVITAVAHNPNASRAQLAAVLRNNPKARSAVAGHPNADPRWLAKWAEELSWTDGSYMMCGLANNPATPPETLALLLSKTPPDVHKIIFANPNCPEEYRSLAQVASIAVG